MGQIKLEKKLINRWALVFAVVMMMLCLGALYAWSLFNTPLIDANPGWDLAGVSLTFGVTIIFMCIAAIVGGALQDKIGPRIVATAGGVLFSVGIMLTSTATEIWHLYLYYGAIGGFGLGCVYGPALATIIKWFPDKRGLISGIGVAGFGAGAMIAKPIILTLIANYGVSNTFLYLGIVYFIIVVAGAQTLVVPPANYKPAGWEPSAGSEATNINFTTGQMMSTIQFYFIWIMFHFGCVAGLMVISIAVNIGTDLVKLDAILAANVVVAIALFNALGRIAWGAISDKIGRIRALTAMFSLAALAMFLMSYIDMTYVSFLALGSLIGFCFGGFLSTFPALTADYYGNENLGKNYGVVILAFGTAALIGGSLVARFEFTQAFSIAALLCLIAAFMTLFVRKPELKINI